MRFTRRLCQTLDNEKILGSIPRVGTRYRSIFFALFCHFSFIGPFLLFSWLMERTGMENVLLMLLKKYGARKNVMVLIIRFADAAWRANFSLHS